MRISDYLFSSRPRKQATVYYTIHISSYLVNHACFKVTITPHEGQSISGLKTTSARACRLDGMDGRFACPTDHAAARMEMDGGSISAVPCNAACLLSRRLYTRVYTSLSERAIPSGVYIVAGCTLTGRRPGHGGG